MRKCAVAFNSNDFCAAIFYTHIYSYFDIIRTISLSFINPSSNYIRCGPDLSKRETRSWKVSVLSLVSFCLLIGGKQ
jgi:hypothetical protein